MSFSFWQGHELACIPLHMQLVPCRCSKTRCLCFKFPCGGTGQCLSKLHMVAVTTCDNNMLQDNALTRLAALMSVCGVQVDIYSFGVVLWVRGTAHVYACMPCILVSCQDVSECDVLLR